MEIASNSINQQSFKRLNITNVSTWDRPFIKSDYRELKKLGEQYDIRLTSCYANDLSFDAIDIDIRPLKKGMNFIKSLFRPIGNSCFITETSENILKSKEEFMQAVHEAIADLKNKVNLHK